MPIPASPRYGRKVQGRWMVQEAVAKAVGQTTGSIDELAEVSNVAKALRASLTATIERLHDLGYVDDVQQEGLKDSLTGGA